MTEFEKEIDLIKKMGLKTNPLRLEYENKVHAIYEAVALSKVQ